MKPFFTVDPKFAYLSQRWLDYVGTTFTEKESLQDNLEAAFTHNFSVDTRFTDYVVTDWLKLIYENKQYGRLHLDNISILMRKLYERSSKSDTLKCIFNKTLQLLTPAHRVEFLTHDLETYPDAIGVISHADEYVEQVLEMAADIFLHKEQYAFKYMAQHVLSADTTSQLQHKLSLGTTQTNKYTLCNNYIKIASGVFNYEEQYPGSVVFDNKDRELEWLCASCLFFDYMIDSKLMTPFVLSLTLDKLNTRFKELDPELYQNYQKTKPLLTTGLVSDLKALYCISMLKEGRNSVELPQLDSFS